MDIEYYDHSYYESPEFKKLKLKCIDAETDNKIWLSACSDLKLSFNGIIDWTNLYNQDRCYRLSMEVLNNDESKHLFVYVSIIAPYYAMYLGSHNSFVGSGKIINFEPYVLNVGITDFIAETLNKSFIGYSLFPNYLINDLIPNISLPYSSFGEVTFFNAFFTDHIL
jgi:hypothetical protein